MAIDRRRQYRSGSIFQRADGMWIGRFEAGTDHSGKRRRITVSARTESACRERLEAKKVEIARTGIPEKVTGRAATVESWSKEWLSIVVADLRPKSYATTSSSIKKWVIPTIGRKRLVDLTPADVRAVDAAMRAVGRKPASRLRVYIDLNTMLKAAILEGHPVPDRVLMVKRPKQDDSDREAMPRDEAVAVLQAAQNPAELTRWSAALLNGLRQGEALALTWDAIDFERDEIDVRWQLQPLPYRIPRDRSSGFRVPTDHQSRHLVDAMHLVLPKSRKSRRVVPLTDRMKSLLLAYRDVAPLNPYGLLWVNERGRPLTDKEDREAWHEIQRRAGVEHPSGRPYHGHETRHTTITLLRALGTQKEDAAAIVGQSKLLATYDHTDRSASARKALTGLSDLLAIDS